MEQINILKQFNDEEINSFIAMQLYIANKNTNETKFLGSFVTNELKIKIKIIYSGVLLDINYLKIPNEDYSEFSEFMELYDELKKQKDIDVINMITIADGNEIIKEQLHFCNPIFNLKSSNKLGHPINGYRLLYAFDSVFQDDGFEDVFSEIYLEEDEDNNEME